MADISRNIRLAVDTGKVAFGMNEVAHTIAEAKAKLVIVAKKGKKDAVDDIVHSCKVAELKAVQLEISSVELGTLCGKPYPVNALAIIEPGNSNILNENY